MARSEKFRFSHTRKLDTAARFVGAAQDAGVLMHASGGANGRHVILDGVPLLNFGSCSYMGLESRSELRQAAHQAIEEYGTQFSFSRVYLQCPLYLELEAGLEQIAERPVLVAPSTTLAHMAALPVLVQHDDFILIDQFAHASLHAALEHLPNVPIEVVRHNDMSALESQFVRASQRARHVWYIADGLYSMHGDFAPLDELEALLERHAQLRIYFDDAHATSWLGRSGRGVALERFASDPRVVVALSLNKAFAAAGGALALPDAATKLRIRRCGGPMLFSGPIQPPMLGAAVDSLRLHMSPQFGGLQAQLGERLDQCLALLQQSRLDIVAIDRSPIFQARCDSPRLAFRATRLLTERGYYCCACAFPAVPINRPGIRFTLSRHNALEDIAPFLVALQSAIVDAGAEIARKSDISELAPLDEVQILAG